MPHAVGRATPANVTNGVARRAGVSLEGVKEIRGPDDAAGMPH